ncbi:MAG: RHS repeat-associated core domain-containing protein, partial [Candidatus Saccharimonadales bacterium]
EAQADHDDDRYGFTHQEMLDNVGIVHMNGRVYDTNLGRFLSVDPVFEFPTNTQSLNPYSYVLNNPLSLTDPSGYCAVTSADMDKSNTTICGSGGGLSNELYKGHNNTGSMNHLLGPALAAFSNALQKAIATVGSNKDALEKKFGSGTFMVGWNKNQAVLLKGNGGTGEADKPGTNTADLLSGSGASARKEWSAQNYGTNNTIATYPDGSQIIDAYSHKPMIAPEIADTSLLIAFGKGIAALPVSERDTFMFFAFKPHGFLDYQHNVFDQSDKHWYGQYMGYGNYIYGVVGSAAGYTRMGISTYGAGGVFIAHIRDAIRSRQAWRLVPTSENWTEWKQGEDDYDSGKLNYH